MRFPISLVFALGLGIPTAALATGDQASRYPFDPVCPWGRLSNGKGMLHRCISEDEARALATAPAPTPAKKEGAQGTSAEAPRGKSENPESVTPPARNYDLTLGPISAEQGDITIGRLDVPLDLYRKCIDDNGGLKEASGQIVVKFLVRAERVRAEAASVESYEHVTAKAAECIAGVVDRRQVGTPSVPLTGAKLTFSLRQKK
jgi:hypothetical protein